MKVEVSDEIVALCVQNAVSRTKGVHDLSGGLADNISKNLFGKTSIYKGMKINQTEDKVTVDVSITVDYGVKIPDVAWNLQENVKKEIEDVLGLNVAGVNIYIAGVHFND